jgi:hypothetical protein
LAAKNVVNTTTRHSGDFYFVMECSHGSFCIAPGGRGGSLIFFVEDISAAKNCNTYFAKPILNPRMSRLLIPLKMRIDINLSIDKTKATGCRSGTSGGATQQWYRMVPADLERGGGGGVAR